MNKSLSTRLTAAIAVALGRFRRSMPPEVKPKIKRVRGRNSYSRSRYTSHYGEKAAARNREHAENCTHGLCMQFIRATGERIVSFC